MKNLAIQSVKFYERRLPKTRKKYEFGCRCPRDHKNNWHGLSINIWEYRGYRGIAALFHKEPAIPIDGETHFAISLEAIVGLSILDEFKVLSKYKIEYKRLAFVSNAGDFTGIYVCSDFYKEIME